MISAYSPNGNWTPPTFMQQIRDGVKQRMLRADGVTGTPRTDRESRWGGQDPAHKIPGMAPNFSEYTLPHVTTFQGFFGTFSRVYRTSDEALNDSWENARYMRNDPGVMECVEARQRAVALLPWHIEPEDPKSSEQIALVADMKKILDRVPFFTAYRYSLLHSTWYGRYAIQHRYGWQNVGGNMRVLPKRLRDDYGWKPIHGDKLVWRYDDGTGANLVDQVGIRVGAKYQQGNRINRRWEVEPTDRGLAYFLADWERSLLTIHKNTIEDGAFESPMDAGLIHGLGIRHRIYWEWFQKQEALAFLMEYLERSAGGIEVHYYPEGNASAKERVEQAIKERVSNGHNVMLYPRPAGDDAMQYGVDFIEPGTGGLESLITLLTTYYGHRIKRYILGQVLSSEAEATGLGSGVADLHENTLQQILQFDAINLEETITYDFLRILQHWNFPKSKHIHLRFVIDVETEDVKEALEGMGKAFEMGARLKEADVLDRIGAEPPGVDDVVLSKSQQAQQEQQSQMAMMGGGAAGGQPAPGGAQPPTEPYSAETMEEEMLRYVFGDPQNAKNGEITYAAENGKWKKRRVPDFDTGERIRPPEPVAEYASGQKPESGEVFALDKTLKPSPPKPAEPPPKKKQQNLPGVLPDYKTPSIRGQKEMFSRFRESVARYRFLEQEHPRDNDGKFADKAGGGTATADEPEEDADFDAGYFKERAAGQYQGKPYSELSREEMFEAIKAGEEIPARFVSQYPGLLKEAKAAREQQRTASRTASSDIEQHGERRPETPSDREKFDPETAPEPVVKRLPGSKRDLKSLRETDDGRWVGATLMHVDDLHVDPARFQYKFVGIDPKTGVTAELKEVKQFNPELGGQLLVWYDPEDGKTYVVNGHHRAELARRSPHSDRWGGELSVYFVDAKTPAEARARGALANMAEGRGTAVDAAKFLRDTGKTVDDLKAAGISLKGSIAQNGSTLANLSDRIFQKLSNGVIAEGRALAIATELWNDPILQNELFTEIERAEAKKGGRPIADSVVSEMAKEYAAVPQKSETVKSLFGDEELRRSLMVERATIKSEIRKSLSEEHSAFRAVAGGTGERRKGMLEREDINRIDVERSREELQKAAVDLDTFDRLVNYKGPISEAINLAAQELADAPRRKKSILTGLLEHVRNISRSGEATET